MNELMRFADEVAREVEARIGKVCEAAEVEKNGERRICIKISTPGSSITAGVYLREDFINGDLDGIVNGVIKSYNDSPRPSSDMVADALASARENIIPCLIKTEGNEAFLNECVNYPLLNMSVYFRLKVQNIGTTVIKKGMLESKGIRDEDLKSIALANINTTEIRHLSDIVRESMGLSKEEFDGIFADAFENDPFVVRTNIHFGANVMLLDTALQDFRATHGDFYILPSSVHECIFVPVPMAMEYERRSTSLKDLVMAVNSECVELQDKLSDSVYLYDETGLSIAR